MILAIFAADPLPPDQPGLLRGTGDAGDASIAPLPTDARAPGSASTRSATSPSTPATSPNALRLLLPSR